MFALGQLFPVDDFKLLALILGMPLLGAAVNGIWGQRLGKEAVRLMALAAVGVSFLGALVAFFMLAHAVDATGHTETVDGVASTVHDHVRLAWTAWDWMHTSGGDGGTSVPIPIRFSIDALSGVMMLVVTGVGFLIHLYSSAYMADDKAYWRFFTYLNLFIFSMLVLILGDNLPLLFVGWEGVGLCSYLLIGFWYDKMPNAAAGKKAFLANRVGDFGLICGMFLLAHYCGALDWSGLSNGAEGLLHSGDVNQIHLWPIGGGEFRDFHLGPLPIPMHLFQPKVAFTITGATAVGLALLLGCTGKSAQIPLYIWLPDAMAGPTPVSALIHAATMVTAGIYLICRLSFIFVLSPFVMMMIACIGAATAIFAASIALVQNDIKKVLAYSTVSQLGYMFLGVGVGAFSAGFFHVFTHAFFKACLFLGAGSVIHAMHARVHDDVASQDIRNMGGLRKYMPLTYWTFFVSTLAIAGCPPLSGFFSKDEILYRAYVNQSVQPFGEPLVNRLHMFTPPPWLGPVLYTVGLVTAIMTAFYMFRLTFVTFWGDFRGWTVGRPSLLARQELATGHDDGHAEHEESQAHAHGGDVHAHDDAHGHDAQGAHGGHHDDDNELIETHDDHAHDHHEDLTTPGYPPHESPWPMTVPLIILGTFAALAGFLNAGILHFAPIDHWLEPVFAGSAERSVHLRANAEHLEWPLAACGIAAFLIGSGIAYWVYVLQAGKPAKGWADAAPGLHQILSDKWKVDELYEATVYAGTDALADTAVWVDRSIIDTLLATVSSTLVKVAGVILRLLQTGVVHVYAGAMVVGLAGLALFFVVPHADLSAKDDGGGSYVVSAAPGIGYSYKWDADGNGTWDAQQMGAVDHQTVKVNPGETKTVRLMVTNAFGFSSTTSTTVSRPEATKTLEIGQNP
jgi:NADH-quinone oxidoreductase subunit L